MGLEKWGEGYRRHWVQGMVKLRAVGGSAADVVWVRELKGRGPRITISQS